MMNNTDKLLRAFIEAQGYEVEEGDSTAGDLINRMYSSSNYSTKEMNEIYPNKHIVAESFGGKWVVSEPITDYKVTKKEFKIDPLKYSKREGIFMGNWKGTDIFVNTNQEDELREMILYMGERNE